MRDERRRCALSVVLGTFTPLKYREKNRTVPSEQSNGGNTRHMVERFDGSNRGSVNALHGEASLRVTLNAWKLKAARTQNNFNPRTDFIHTGENKKHRNSRENSVVVFRNTIEARWIYWLFLNS